MVLMGKPNISDFISALSRFDIQGIERLIKKVAFALESILDCVIQTRKSSNTSTNITSTTKAEKKGFLHFLLELTEQKDSNGLSITTPQIKALFVV